MNHWFGMWLFSFTSFWIVFACLVFIVRMNRRLREQLRLERQERIRDLIEKGRRDALRGAPDPR